MSMLYASVGSMDETDLLVAESEDDRLQVENDPSHHQAVEQQSPTSLDNSNRADDTITALAVEEPATATMSSPKDNHANPPPPAEPESKHPILLSSPKPTRTKIRRKARSLSPSKQTRGKRGLSPTKKTGATKDAVNKVGPTAVLEATNSPTALSSKSDHVTCEGTTNTNRQPPSNPKVAEVDSSPKSTHNDSSLMEKSPRKKPTRSLSAKKHRPRIKKEATTTRRRRKSDLGIAAVQEYRSSLQKQQEKNSQGQEAQEVSESTKPATASVVIAKQEDQQPCSPPHIKATEDENKTKHEGEAMKKDPNKSSSPPVRKQRSRSLRVAPSRRSSSTGEQPSSSAGIGRTTVEQGGGDEIKNQQTNAPSAAEPTTTNDIIATSSNTTNTKKKSPRRRVKRSNSANLILEQAMASIMMHEDSNDRQLTPKKSNKSTINKKKLVDIQKKSTKKDDNKTTKPSAGTMARPRSPKKKKGSKDSSNNRKKENKDDTLVLLSDEETNAETSTGSEDDSFPTAEDDSHVAILHTSQECFLQFTIPNLDE